MMSSKKSANLYVGGIPHTWDTKALTQAFRAYGNVVSAKVMIDLYSGESRGFGFVLFDSVDVADKVVAAVHNIPVVMNGEEVTLRCSPAAFRDQEEPECANERIYIRNLPQVISQDQVFQTFRHFGKIVDISIPRNTMSGAAKGVALIRFDSVETAQKAKRESHGQCLFEEDVPLIVRFASSEGGRGGGAVHQSNLSPNQSLNASTMPAVFMHPHGPATYFAGCGAPPANLAGPDGGTMIFPATQFMAQPPMYFAGNQDPTMMQPQVTFQQTTFLPAQPMAFVPQLVPQVQSTGGAVLQPAALPMAALPMTGQQPGQSVIFMSFPPNQVQQAPPNQPLW